MDFLTLSRKELQTLCKKNKIPANITNVAMANALAALPQVEGLDEFLNPREGDFGTPAQRKEVGEEAEGSKVKVSTRFQRGTKAGIAEGVVEQENKDANIPLTPAVLPGSRRRVNAVSARRKKEAEMLVEEDEDDDKNVVQGKLNEGTKTPAAAPSSRRRATGRSVCPTTQTPGGTSVQRAYNTRRSVRLLEKNLSKMNLMDTEEIGLGKIDYVSEELSNVSQQVEGSPLDTGKGASLQTVSLSTVVSEDTLELEVSSQEKNTEYECQSHNLGSDEKLVSETKNEPRKVNHLDAEEPHYSNETGSEFLPVLEESGDSSELKTENKEYFGARQRQDTLPIGASDAIPDAALNVVVPEDVSVDVADQDVSVDVTDQDVSVSLKELVECKSDDLGYNEGGIKEDKNDEQQEAEPHNSNLDQEASSDTCNDSDEADSDMLPVPEVSCDSSELEIENSEYIEARQDPLPCGATEEAFMEITDRDIVAMDVNGQDVVAGLLPMSSVNYVSVNQKEFLDDNIDNDQDGNEGDANQDKNDETEDLNVACGNYIQNFEPTYNVDEEATDEKVSASPEVVFELGSSTFSPSVKHQEEEMEAKPEKLEESKAETEKTDDAYDILNVEEDTSSENHAAVIEVCTESSADGKESTPESSFLDAEAEDNVLDAENLEAEAQDEESEEHAVGEDTVLDVDNPFSSVVNGICSPQVLLVDGDAVSADIAIPKQESIHKQNADMMKENMTTDELGNMSIGELKRMLKKLTLDEKSNCKTINVAKEMKKRTALQALPHNQMTTGEAQNDG